MTSKLNGRQSTKQRSITSRISGRYTPTLKFYCRAREVGEHVVYAIEPVLRQKIDSRQAEMESILYNSTPLEKVGEARR